MKNSLLVASLVLILCFAFGCQKGKEPAAKKEAEPNIIVNSAISTDGVSIAYEVRGEGSPALAFVHGWSNKRGIWDAILAHFSRKYKVIATDLAGFGDSGNNRENWTMELYGDDVAAVLDKLKLKNVVLIGFSMGGPVVIEAAMRAPGRIVGIVLVDTLQDIEMVYSQEDISGVLEDYMSMVDELRIEKVETFFKKNREELGERIISTMLKGVPKVGWRESLADYFRWSNEECITALQKISVPVIAINSDQSPTNVDAFKKYVPSFEAKIISGVGHVIFWEAPEEFNQLLEEAVQNFIQREKSK